MADAQITLKLSPSEYDTTVKALRHYRQAQYEAQKSTGEGTPQEKRESRAQSVMAGNLLERIAPAEVVA